MSDDRFEFESESPEEFEEKEEFELEEEDWEAVQTAVNVARRMLRDPRIKPAEIVGLGRALYALERLPRVTPGVEVEFGVSYERDDGEYGDSKYVSCTVSDWILEITSGGSMWSKAVGSDSYTTQSWTCELGCGPEGWCNSGYIEDLVEELIEMGGQLSVTDNSSSDLEVGEDAEG